MPTVPLAIISPQSLESWAYRLLNAVPTDVEETRIPSIRAPTVTQAVSTLLFLVQWNFEHFDQPQGYAKARDFRDALAAQFGNAVVCNYSSLADLLRRSRVLDLAVYVGH